MGLKRERRELNPSPAELHFFFGEHTCAEDAAGLEPIIKQCDIFVPEAAHHTEEFVTMLQDVSNGVIDVRQATAAFQQAKIDFSNDYMDGVMSLLYNSHKEIWCADVKNSDRVVTEKMLGGEEQMGNGMAHFLLGKYDMGSTTFGEGKKQFAQAQAQREAIITKRLQQKIVQWHERNPGKPRPKIAIALGATHSAIAHTLSQSYPTERHWQKKPLSFSPSEEHDRRILYNKPKLVHPSQLIVEELISWHYDSLLAKADVIDPKTEEKIVKLIRLFCTTLTPDDLKIVSEQTGQQFRRRQLQYTANDIINQQFPIALYYIQLALQKYHLTLDKNLP